jgi:hypothetical protein
MSGRWGEGLPPVGMHDRNDETRTLAPQRLRLRAHLVDVVDEEEGDLRRLGSGGCGCEREGGKAAKARDNLAEKEHGAHLVG